MGCSNSNRTQRREAALPPRREFQTETLPSRPAENRVDRLLPSFSDIYFRKIEVCVIVVPMSAIEMGNARQADDDRTGLRRTWRPSNAVGGAGTLPDRRWLMAAEVVIKQFLRLEARKPLKTLVSDERIQGNPRKSNT
jgi:hypothetical protein